MENMDKKVERMVRGSAKRRLWKRFVAIPAAVVVFITTYALILPAIALEGDTYCGIEPHRHTEDCYTAELACGYEDGAVVQDVETWIELACAAQPHQHTEACFDDTGAVICGYADYFIHEHNADCYDASGALVCPLPEVKAHTHDESCYVTETVNVCGQEESAGHVHDESCYTLVSHPELICGQAESAGHVHDESCYTTTEHTYLACGQEESAGHVHDEGCYTVTVAEDGTETMELTCAIPESLGHTHTEACYVTEPVTELTCGQEESVGHVHTDACWANVETMELTCGQEESAGHTHDESCFAEQSVLVCTQPEVIPHVHGDECWTVTGYAEDGAEIRELTCGMTEIATHVHTADCFATYETTVERPHQHTDLCYIQVLTCTLPEHEHTDECYVAPEPTADPEASAEPQYICGLDEHTHGDACYDENNELICQLPEHTHDEACLPVVVEIIEDDMAPAAPQYICGMEEHTHDETCYDENGALICELAEHTHDESCQAVVEIIEDDMAPAAPEYICGMEEHTHSETCYDENGALICELAEHTHDETCLAEVVDIEGSATPLLDRLVLICDKEEHVHGPECMNEALEYICGKEVHEHTAECYATVSDDGKIVYCGIAEHTHDGNCYDANGLLICQLPEHTHDELCFLPPEAAELKYAATRQVKTFENDDVLVTVVYGPEAHIPEDAELFVYQVTEQSSPERYAQRVAEMKAMLMPETLEDVPAEADLEVEETAEELPILIYNIGFYADGVEVEPEAPVTVTVHVLNEDHMPTGESYAIVHFAATRTEMLDNTVDEAGAATFTTESFSDFGVAMRDAETGADTEPLPEPETNAEPAADEAQNDEPIADEAQNDEPVVDEAQNDEPVADESQSGEPVADEPEATELPIIMTGPAMNQATAQAIGGGDDYGIMPMSNGQWNSWSKVIFSATLEGSYYTGVQNRTIDGPTNRSGNPSSPWTTTIPDETGTDPSVGDLAGYDLRGWYPIEFQETIGSANAGHGDGQNFLSYYGAGLNNQTIGKNTDDWNNNGSDCYVVVSRLFYGDWWPENYAAANKTLTGESTSGFATTELFDYNELANIPFTTHTILTSGGGYGGGQATVTGATWSLSGDFAFQNTDKYDPGKIGNPTEGGRNSSNKFATDYGSVSDRIIGGLFYANPTDGSGVNYVGQGEGLYQYDSDTDLYYYDSHRNAAAYNAEDGRFYLSGANSGDNTFRPLGANNCWFGVQSTIYFTLETTKFGGTANQVDGKDKILKVAADDDLLVYVDDQLVLDMTGKHTNAAYGEINFSTGEWAVYNDTNWNGGAISRRQSYGNLNSLNLGGNENTVHTVRIRYVDQSSASSHFAVYFNLPCGDGLDMPNFNTGSNAGTGTMVGEKEIDYLGDGDLNGYKIPAGTTDRTDDLYRLFLTASNDRTANPINVLFVLDESNSMNGKMGPNKNRMGALKDILKGSNGEEGLLDILLQKDSENKVAMVKFSSSASQLQDWTSDLSTAERAVDRLNIDGGTNYEAALNQAKILLTRIRNTNPNPTYMIFISDGVPTYYVNDERKRDGSGSDNTDNLNEVYPDTMKAIKKFIEDYPWVIRYSVGISNNFSQNIKYGDNNGRYARREPIDWLDSTGTCKIASDIQTLQDVIKRALELTPVSSIYIQDTLSDYVEFAGGASNDPRTDSITDLQIWLQKTDRTDRTLVWDKDGSHGTISGTGTTADGQPYVKSVDWGGKTIKVTFTPDYVLPNNYKFEVSFNVRANELAFNTYAGYYVPNPTQLVYGGNLGHQKTNHLNNTTSGGNPGFDSNLAAEAEMTFKQDGRTWHVVYPEPVVQVWRPRVVVTKYGDEEKTKPLPGATFTVWNADGSVRDTYTTNDNGQIIIDNLPTGKYTLQETAAPDGYKTDTEPFTFEVKHGMIVTPEKLEGETAWTWNGLLTWSWMDDPAVHAYWTGDWHFDYGLSMTDELANVKLRIVKVSLEGTEGESSALGGAEFDLYKDGGDGVYGGDDQRLNDAPIVSNNDEQYKGYLMFGELTYTEVEEGTYYLVETKAPAGFNLLDKPITINVTYSEGRFHATYSGPYITSVGNAVYEDEADGTHLLKITVNNTTGYALPETGGEGTMMYTLGGIALLALAGAMLCERRRRAARG